MLTPGTLLANRFAIERQAGEGGMSTVFRARDLRTGTTVAIKVLSEETTSGNELLFDEARALATLSHAGVVRYVDHGELEGGAYLAMEWIEGESLADRLLRGPLTVAETLTLAIRVSEALAAAHGAGLVHRDIKPGNLLLPGGVLDRVTLVDFGIARGHKVTRATHRTGAIVGTPAYMAPEQARGERGVDARADVFSLGCVLYECLAGVPPFRGAHVMAVLLKVVLEDPPRLCEVVSDVPEALDEIIGRMLTKDRAARPADGTALEVAFLSLRAPRRIMQSSGTMAVLTAGEQRLLSIVLARAPLDGQAVDDTIAMLDPHDVGGTLGAVRHAVQSHQAFFERLADGSIVATLSATGAATDLAIRAARLSVALRAVLKGWSFALATGRGELSARWPVGEAVDRAVELLGRPGTIRLDDATAGLLAAHFELEGADRTPELGAEREAPETSRTLLGRPTPHVGREQELLGILGSFEHCVAERVARVVLVVGAAGIGKSRLRHELLRVVAGRTELLVSRGDSQRAGAPFGLLGPAVRRLCRIRDGEDAETRRSKLLARVSSAVAAGSAPRVARFLGELAGVPFPDDDVQLRAARQDAPLMSDQMRRAFEEWLGAECARRPVTLVLDDLHWGDAPTVRYVDMALGALHDAPLFVLALARPEVDAAFPGLWSDRGVDRITLGPLTRRSSERLVRAVLGAEVSAERISSIVARAEGNAFFLEELVRAEAAGQGENAPATVLAMLHSRIEALPPATRRVLRAASVFGRTFWRGAVDTLLGGVGTVDLDAALDDLVRAEIVVRRAESRFPGEDQLAMRHDLFRDAAYATLTEADRTLGHRLAARWLEQAGEQDALVLAEHLERGGQPTRAVPWWVTAARQALERNDLDAAMQRAQRGVSAGATGAALGGLRLVQLEVANWRGESSLALESGLAALAALPKESAAWFVAAGEVTVASGRLAVTERLQAMGDLLRDAQATGPHAAVAAFAFARAIPPLVYAGEHARADALLARLPEVDDVLAATEPRLAGHARWARAIRAISTGDIAAYLRDMEASSAFFEQAGDLRSACLSRVHVGYAATELGDLDRAESILREALSIARRMNVPVVETLALHNLGLTLTKKGALDEAWAVESESCLRARGQNPRIEAASHCYLAEILARRGVLSDAHREVVTALEAVDETLAPVREPPNADGTEAPRAGVPVAAIACAVLARVLTAQGQQAAALQAARRAMSILAHLGALEEGEGLVRLVHAELLDATGAHAAARAAIAHARQRLLDRASRIGDPTLRGSFLHKVEEHARTLALAASWEV